jgi:hypothetical protein
MMDASWLIHHHSPLIITDTPPAASSSTPILQLLPLATTSVFSLKAGMDLLKGSRVGQVSCKN